MLLKKDLSQCKDLRTVEHLAQQFGWYAAAWTPQEPHLICSDEQFTEFAKAMGKLAVTQDGENLLYFLALAAETAQERKNRMDRILERKLFYETSTVITEEDIARCHNDQLATPPGVRKADAMETLHFLAPPEEEKQDDTAPNGIVSISAKDLQDKEFKPIKWVVEGLLPQGLALLVAPPKYGKSWLMLDLCLSVASGQKFLDMPTNKTDCLYLALEDNQRRLQDRMNRVLQGERAPDGFALATGSLDLQDGLLDQLTSAVGGVLFADFADPTAPKIEKIHADGVLPEGMTLCVTDTRASHSELTGEFAAIRNEMEAVAACLGGKVLGEVEEKRFWQELPRLREQCGDRAVLRAIHYFEENARTLAQREALTAGDFAAFVRLVEASGHSSFELCQNVYCAASPQYQGLSAALALSQSILAGSGGAWRMQGGGFAGTIQAFVPDALVERYCAAMESIFGPGCCYLLCLREQGAMQVL